VTVTVGDIVSIPGLPLRLVAGNTETARPIRWVHVSELEDPTPWLKGGELLLTTGMGILATAPEQRAYVKRLAKAGLAGLGFGLGFSYDAIPKPLVAAAKQLKFPLFEVPYPVPFIAITEAVFTRTVAEQVETLQRAVDAEHALTRAVMEGAGLEGIALSLAGATGGWSLVLDLHGLPLAASSRSAASRAARIWDDIRASRPEGTSFSLTLVDRDHYVWVQPVVAGERVEAFLVVGKPEQPTQLDRIVAGHALSLFAIELATSRAVAEAERRLQGDFFDELAGGELSAPETERGLERFGFARDASVVALALSGGEPSALALAVTDRCARAGGGFLVSVRADGVVVLVPGDPEVDAAELGKVLATRLGQEVRVGAGSTVGPLEVGRSLREATYALRVCRLEGWSQAGFEDLGTYRLLLSMTEPDALRAFADAMLAPLDAYDEAHGGELLPSLRAYLEANARWEAAAGQLYVHRHTLRYRIHKVEELTGRDLGSSFDRMEFWLALRARDLLLADAGP
jgi:PucR family transcriptional regulator, purine catabolism regulatory protein